MKGDAKVVAGCKYDQISRWRSVRYTAGPLPKIGLDRAERGLLALVGGRKGWTGAWSTLYEEQLAGGLSVHFNAVRWSVGPSRRYSKS